MTINVLNRKLIFFSRMQSDMLMTYGVLDANQLDNICKLFKNSKDIKQTTINVLTRLGHLVAYCLIINYQLVNLQVLNKKEDFKDYLINDYQIGGAVDKEYKCSKKEFEDWIKCFSAKCKIFGNRINFGYKLHFPEGNDSTYSLIVSLPL